MCALVRSFIDGSFCLPLHLYIGMAPRPGRMLLKSKWLRYLSSMVEFICFLSQMVVSQSLGEHLPTLDRLKISTNLNFVSLIRSVSLHVFLA